MNTPNACKENGDFVRVACEKCIYHHEERLRVDYGNREKSFCRRYPPPYAEIRDKYFDWCAKFHLYTEPLKLNARGEIEQG